MLKKITTLIGFISTILTLFSLIELAIQNYIFAYVIEIVILAVYFFLFRNKIDKKYFYYMGIFTAVFAVIIILGIIFLNSSFQKV